VLLVLAAIGLALAAGAARAEDFDAIVTRVSDGDSVRVRPLDGGPPRVLRLVGMDAPERCQAYGAQARAALARQVLWRPVRVEAGARDRYQRELARLGTPDIPDLNAWMVAQGHAWSYRLREDPGPYARQEALARQEGRGLWAQPSPQEPRAFRRLHGPCH
jgi:endonuclease YncB( thermonuclease family)